MLAKVQALESGFRQVRRLTGSARGDPVPHSAAQQHGGQQASAATEVQLGQTASALARPTARQQAERVRVTPGQGWPSRRPAVHLRCGQLQAAVFALSEHGKHVARATCAQVMTLATCPLQGTTTCAGGTSWACCSTRKCAAWTTSAGSTRTLASNQRCISFTTPSLDPAPDPGPAPYPHSTRWVQLRL